MSNEVELKFFTPTAQSTQQVLAKFNPDVVIAYETAYVPLKIRGLKRIGFNYEFQDGSPSYTFKNIRVNYDDDEFVVTQENTSKIFDKSEKYEMINFCSQLIGDFEDV